MSEKYLQPLSAFEWASVAQYTVYINGAAGLQEVNSIHVLYLPLAKVTPQKLLARKMKVATALKSNLRSLEGFVGRFRDELEDVEMSVIRGMYRQFQDNLKTVEGHMDVIEDFARTSHPDMFKQTEVKEDELPF